MRGKNKEKNHIPNFKTTNKRRNPWNKGPSHPLNPPPSLYPKRPPLKFPLN
jgi:hypothetical protein